MIDNTCANFFCAKVSRVEESMDCCQEVPEKQQRSPDCSCDWASGQLSGKPATLSAVLFASVTSQQVEVEAPGSCLERGKPGQSVHAYLKLKSWEAKNPSLQFWINYRCLKLPNSIFIAPTLQRQKCSIERFRQWRQSVIRK